MSIVDRALATNDTFRREFRRTEPVKPIAAIVTCMDARLNRLDQILGVDAASVQVVRNGGAVVTEDVLRSLTVSVNALGTPEILILGHTGCAVSTLDERELETRLHETSGEKSLLTHGFRAFTDPAENVRRGVSLVRRFAWIPNHVVVRGALYDVDTGEVREVDCD